jgi:gliding motility-associated-like protein
MWSVVNGVCEPVSDNLQVSINDLQTFTGFSPNGDGVNDDFILILSGEVDAELIIFDQWGGIVFSESKSNAEEFRWNGELNNSGNPVPEGTYFFLLKEGGEVVKKHYVELRR